MKYMPYGVVAGTVLVALVASIVLGEWLIVAVVLPCAVAYLLLDRSVRRRGESREEQLAAEPPGRAASR